MARNIKQVNGDPVRPALRALNKMASIAKETIEITKNKKYTLNGLDIDLPDDAVNNTKYYPGDTDFAESESINVATLEITNETTTQAAVRLLGLGKKDIAALNFASARNQGGGFLSGAIAQEEDLCRRSNLYACLKRKPMFYNNNLLCDNSLYTDGILYSPNVLFFRDEYYNLIDPYNVSIISAPAPNVSCIEDVDYDLLYKTFSCRAKKVLSVATLHGHRILILGAWGCGAFGNSPIFVANVFRDALKYFSFDHICFAVYDKNIPPVNYEAFLKVMAL